MPPFIKGSPLKAYARGDGYWIWKPFILWKTLQEHPNDIVVYADCGCSLQTNRKEWESWFTLLESYKTLAFQYRSDFQYPWLNAKVTGMACEQWTKQSLVEYFDPLFGDRNWIHSNQIWAGVILARGNNPLVKMWLDISLFHPEFLMDVFGNEMDIQNHYFIEHRHDQSLWSDLCLYWETKLKIVRILQETSESNPESAIVASRIHDSPREPIKNRIVRFSKEVFGDSFYHKLHFWGKKYEGFNHHD